jgi:hypothetical protein
MNDTPLPPSSYTADEFMAVNAIAERFLAVGKSAASPVFALILGGMGAGKTTLRRSKFGDSFVHVDFGDVYLAFEKDTSFALEKKDPRRMAAYGVLACEIILRKSIMAKKNIVVELIGDDAFAVTFLMEMMKGAGYEVQVCPIYGDIAEAVARYKQAVKDDPDYISAYDSQQPTISIFYEVSRKLGLPPKREAS